MTSLRAGPRTSRARRAFAAALTLAVALLATTPASGAEGTPDEVAAELAKALSPDVPEEVRLDAVAAARGVADPAVIALLAKAARDRSVTVRRAAIEALGAVGHPDALRALHDLYRGQKKLREDEDTFVLLLRSIGRKGDPSSVAVLTDDPFSHVTFRVARARILGLGRIRTKEAAEGLVGFTKLAGGGSRRASSATSAQRGEIDQDFRLALAELTGEDPGAVRGEFPRWWRDRETAVRIAPQRPDLPPQLVARWEAYWGEPYYVGRPAPQPPTGGPPFTIVQNPARELVEEAVASLAAAFAPGVDPKVRIAAIEDHAGIVHPDVVAEVAKGLRDADEGVLLASIDALGWIPSKDALRALHRAFRREKSLRKEEVPFARLLRSIGRHGDPSSLEVLKDDVFDELTLASGKARILGASRIRDRKSVEALFWAMRLGGGDPRGRRSEEPRFLDDFRVALCVLTGVDMGLSKTAWEDWWRDHDRGFRVPAARPPVPPDVKAAWESYWEEKY